MFVKYTINSNTLLSGTTASTINIPISLDYQFIDATELVETQFVDIEVKKAINPILDYEKARYLPTDMSGTQVTNIIYNIYFMSNGVYQNPSYYSNIGITNDDLKFETNYFTESYILLNFYDTDNPLTQNLITQLDIFSMLTKDDLYATNSFFNGVYIIAGQAKPANQVPVRFILSNPLLVKKAFYEGYHLFDYKDDVSIGFPKYLYMRATYYNAKTGDIKNMMTQPVAYNIDSLVSKLHTRYKLYRDTTGFYYTIDDEYSTNVVYSENQNNTNVEINLFEIQTL